MVRPSLKKAFDSGLLIKARIVPIKLDRSFRSSSTSTIFWFSECLHAKHGWVPLSKYPNTKVIHEYNSFVKALSDLNFIGFSSIEVIFP